jgi:hypothetical protein
MLKVGSKAHVLGGDRVTRKLAILASRAAEAGWSASRNHKLVFLIVGHLATPLSDAAFPSAAARSC